MKTRKLGPRKKTGKKPPPKSEGAPPVVAAEDSPKTFEDNDTETTLPISGTEEGLLERVEKKDAATTPTKGGDVAKASQSSSELKSSPLSGERVTERNTPVKQVMPKALAEAKEDDMTQMSAGATAVTCDTLTLSTTKTNHSTPSKSAVKKSPATGKSVAAKVAASKEKQKEAVVSASVIGGSDVAGGKEDPMTKEVKSRSEAMKETKWEAKLSAAIEGTQLVEEPNQAINKEEHDQVHDNGCSHFNDDEEDAEEEVENDEQEGFQEPNDEGEEDFEPDEEVGEMETEHHVQMNEIMKERKKKKEQEIFVGGLDRDATDKDIKKAFECVGEIIEVRLHKDFITNKNKGFAFVKFATREQASRALSELKFPMVKGKLCGIAPSEDNDTLFLGNICNTWTAEAIRQKLKDYGVDGVENIILVADTQNEGLSRGFAFLEFSCHTETVNAYKRLQKPDVIFGHPERTAKVAFAEPIREPDEEIMSQVKSVFVDGLPPHWDEDRVKEQLKSFGEIERVVLARNMLTAKRKDFGFVNFTTHEAAIACINGLNDTELGDEKMKIKTKARLANPLHKTQAVKSGMRGGFRIGRGFGISRHTFQRGTFPRGRGFFQHGHGGGRFSYVNFAADSRGRSTFGWRGGRRGSFRMSYEGPSNSFDIRNGSFNRGRGRPFQSRWYSHPSEEDFDQPYAGIYYDEGSSYYSGVTCGGKRLFSFMEHDSDYMDGGSRIRPHYDYPDPLHDRPLYEDDFGSGNGSFSHEYYAPDLRGGGHSSCYGGDSMGTTRRGYYY